ncbi:MAG: hypothetical protein KDB27_25705 [Planctomycetales bacterium]|nr:hypothetical protein [Planctomycetales bacterium]
MRLILPVFFVLAFASYGLADSRLYEIQSGSFVETGGFAGQLNYNLPYARQKFVEIRTDRLTNDITMRILSESLEPFQFFGFGAPFGTATQNENDLHFLADVESDFNQKGMLEYFFFDFGDTFQLEGTLRADQVCCDIPFSFSHQAVELLPAARTIVGDFNEDGVLEIGDLDLLYQQLDADQPPNFKFDLGADSSVDAKDVVLWVQQLKDTWIGDANLDGTFDSQDFIAVFQLGAYENDTVQSPGWAGGDWNADGKFDSGDFVAAFADGGYERGGRKTLAIQAVPEPNYGELCFGVLAVFLAATVRKRG